MSSDNFSLPDGEALFDVVYDYFPIGAVAAFVEVLVVGDVILLQDKRWATIHRIEAVLTDQSLLLRLLVPTETGKMETWANARTKRLVYKKLR